MYDEKLIALFLLLTAIAYLIGYILYAERTFNEQQSFFHAAIFFVLGGAFFVIYAIINYRHVVRGKGAQHIDHLDRVTQQGKYAPVIVEQDPLLI